VARVERFVDHLRRRGAVQPRQDVPAPCASLSLVAFRGWLLQHRGLSRRTIERHERMITRVLPSLGTDPSTYDAFSVRRAALAEVSGCGRAQAKTIVTALRVYLRFLATRGECQPCLDRALPMVPEWKLSSLPRYLNADDIDRVIASCDISKAHGVRDRAILLLLVRLGLRGGDVVAMRLDDIDWHDATFLVRGKGRKEVCLPLPQDAGDALLAYLEHARPKVAIDRIFLCAQAPFRPFKSSVSVSDIVRFALQRAGVENPPTRGANLLRHTAATMMLRAGATLDAIGAVLRHRSPDTTAHYAKVDVALLRQIAQPWPEEGVSC
jgi:integrase/recombinase XerD